MLQYSPPHRHWKPVKPTFFLQEWQRFFFGFLSLSLLLSEAEARAVAPSVDFSVEAWLSSSLSCDVLVDGTVGVAVCMSGVLLVSTVANSELAVLKALTALVLALLVVMTLAAASLTRLEATLVIVILLEELGLARPPRQVGVGEEFWLRLLTESL